MAIPAFTIDGILPPYTGADGPGAHPNLMSPYTAASYELVEVFGTTERRQEILDGWLIHRERLRTLGFSSGFQWIDGSFVEDKNPGDIDVVTFTHRPKGMLRDRLRNVMMANVHTFRRADVKKELAVDAFFVDLDGTKTGLVELTRYYLGLFSHRRSDDQWKGMVSVPLAEDDDLQARQWLARNRIADEEEDE